MATPLLCLTCHQSLPKGEDYPGFFGQYGLSPDLTKVDDAANELETILWYLKAVCEVLPDARKISDSTLLELEHLAAQLTEEAQRRAEWLYEAGKAACPDREET
jgi:hypothetical protein